MQNGIFCVYNFGFLHACSVYATLRLCVRVRVCVVPVFVLLCLCVFLIAHLIWLRTNLAGTRERVLPPGS